jgi:hypothetical protein
VSSKPGWSLPADAAPKSQPASNETVRAAGPRGRLADARAAGPRALSTDHAASPAVPPAMTRKKFRRHTISGCDSGPGSWFPYSGKPPAPISRRTVLAVVADRISDGTR